MDGVLASRKHSVVAFSRFQVWSSSHQKTKRAAFRRLTNRSRHHVPFAYRLVTTARARPSLLGHAGQVHHRSPLVANRVLRITGWRTEVLDIPVGLVVVAVSAVDLDAGIELVYYATEAPVIAGAYHLESMPDQ
jgi:hypothetical protein